MRKLIAMMMALAIGAFALSACASESSPEVLDLLKKANKRPSKTR